MSLEILGKVSLRVNSYHPFIHFDPRFFSYLFLMTRKSKIVMVCKFKKFFKERHFFSHSEPILKELLSK